MRRALIVTIDGPAGAGKSSIARALATHMNYVLVDTGALYRTVALAAMRGCLNLVEQSEQVSTLASELATQRAIQLVPDAAAGGVRVELRGEDVSLAIRTPEIALGASVVSAYPGVRDALLSLQRQAGEHGGVVLEGRDIGTVVFPHADVKFFLTASAEERARRRHDELVATGSDASYADTLRDVQERDDRDIRRTVAPLRQAIDARLIDSTGRTLQEVIAQMMSIVEARATVPPPAC